MPEQREAKDAAQNVGAIALGEHLRDHGEQPQGSKGDVHAVATDQGEERGEERTPRRPGALIDHADEFMNLYREKAQTKHAGRRHAAIVHGAVVRPGADGGQAAGETRQQEAPGLDRDIMQIEQILAARPACGLSREHSIGGEERREHDDVAEQEDPKAVADNNALRCRVGVIQNNRGRAPRLLAPAVAVVCACLKGRHERASTVATASPRARRFARSMRATSSAGISYSVRSRQAKTTNVAKAPSRATMTSHQICQIMPKPPKLAKNAPIKPVGLFLGISIAL